MSDKDATAHGHVPQITAQGDGKLKRLQRQFNSKIKEIESLKAIHSEKKKRMAQAQARVQLELWPLIKQTAEVRVKLVRLLDRAYALPDFKKREKDKLAYLIENMSHHLIERNDRKELVDLHDKYADVPYAEAAQKRAKTTVDVEPDTEDGEKLSGSEAQVDLQPEEQETPTSAEQKTEAKRAKEEKVKADMINISKASRRVYTTLAKLLHPDTEQNIMDKAWKEEAMKEITHAYKQDDFFELLRLQTKYLTEQDKQLEQLPEPQLKYYLRLLNEQIKDLEKGNESAGFGADSDFYNQYCGTPAQMDQKFGAARNGLKQQLKQLKQDLRYFEEPMYLRAYLKELTFR